MMACWKRNNFADGLCSNETASFYKCVHNAQVCTHTDVYMLYSLNVVSSTVYICVQYIYIYIY